MIRFIMVYVANNPKKKILCTHENVENQYDGKLAGTAVVVARQNGDAILECFSAMAEYKMKTKHFSAGCKTVETFWHTHIYLNGKSTYIARSNFLLDFAKNSIMA